MTAQKYSSRRGTLQALLIIWGLITPEEHDCFGGWYRRSQAQVFDLAATYGIDRWVASQVVSAVSPAVDWNVNIRYAARTVEAWLNYPHELDRLLYFKEHKVGAPYGWDNFRKAWRILDGDTEIVHKGSPKTYRFARNIFTPYVTRLVTFDSHMYRLWNGSALPQVGSIQFPVSCYLAGERDVQRLADLEGITPETAQEQLWQKHLQMVANGTLPSDLGLDW